MKIINNDLRFTVRSTTYCCGLQEMGDFSFRSFKAHEATGDVEISDDEIVRIKRELTYCANTYAVTVDDKDNHPTQWYAAQVLKAVGFVESQRMRGNGGNPLIMWVYKR